MAEPASTTSRRVNRTGLLAIFFLSGACGVAHQVTWTRLFGLGLGHELPAVLAVLMAFFGGLALGAWGCDARVGRSTRPGRWFAACELVIGSWALVSIGLIPLASELGLKLVGLTSYTPRHWGVAFALPFVVLLPATAAMGVTLPAMERVVAPMMFGRRCVGLLYALNTLGAVAGVWLGAFAVLPTLGFSRTLLTFGLLNCACGAAVWVWESRNAARAAPNSASGQIGAEGGGSEDRPRLTAEGSPRARALPAPVTARLGRRRLLVTIFLTGLLGIGFEVLGVRVLAEVLEGTFYSFAAVLAVYLAGTGLGAALYHRFGRWAGGRRLLEWLLPGLAVACLLGGVALCRAENIFLALRSWLGAGPLASQVAELGVAAVVFGAPTLLMGATFSHLAQAAKREEGGVGQALAVNTVGSALAPVVFGVLALPALGAKWTLVLLALGYLAVVPRVGGWAVVALGSAAVWVLALPGALQSVRAPPGGKLVDYRPGVSDSVAVVEYADGHRSLLVNNRFLMGGTGAATAAQRHAHLPLLWHPAPQRALFLGLGTGITFSAAQAHAGLQADGVELVPEVLQAADYFAPYSAAWKRSARLRVFVADARRFVRVSQTAYDVIVADLFHPARDGAGSLYTREHFAAIRRRLAPGGLFCQWLPLYQLDEPTLRVITRTFLEVFPRAGGFLLRLNVDTPVLGLVAWLEGPRFAPGWTETRTAEAALRDALKPLALTDDFQLFGGYLADAAELQAFAGQGAVNTDDFPVVTFRAPRFVYGARQSSYGRLLTLLDRCKADPRTLFAPDTAREDGEFIARLDRFIQARNVYLRGLVADVQGRRAEAIDAFIESARLSPDFSTGYAHVLALAAQTAQADAPQARRLLERLAAARPDRGVAQQLLERLPAGR
jgi:spermidine synthase